MGTEWLKFEISDKRDGDKRDVHKIIKFQDAHE